MDSLYPYTGDSVVHRTAKRAINKHLTGSFRVVEVANYQLTYCNYWPMYDGIGYPLAAFRFIEGDHFLSASKVSLVALNVGLLWGNEAGSDNYVYVNGWFNGNYTAINGADIPISLTTPTSGFSVYYDSHDETVLILRRHRLVGARYINEQFACLFSYEGLKKWFFAGPHD